MKHEEKCTAKFMFDECLSEAAMEGLDKITPKPHIFAHVISHFKSGIHDDVWIPKLGEDGGWVVISADRGKGSSKGGKLPELCKEHKVTHVLLSGKLHQKKSHEKISAIGLLWGEISKLHLEPPGSCFIMRMVTSKKGTMGVRLRKDHDLQRDPRTHPFSFSTWHMSQRKVKKRNIIPGTSHLPPGNDHDLPR